MNTPRKTHESVTSDLLPYSVLFCSAAMTWLPAGTFMMRSDAEYFAQYLKKNGWTTKVMDGRLERMEE